MKNTTWRTIGTNFGFFALGALVVFVTARANPGWFVKQKVPKVEQDIFRRFDTQFGPDFFSHDDPFEEMKRFRENLGQNPDLFDRWFGKHFGGGTAEDISRREDGDYIYFDIKVPDLKSTSVQTKVNDGYVTIDGKTATKSQSENGETSFESVFHRTFPAPANADASKMEVSSEGNGVVLKFPKLKK
jgi:HSP20 family molecular chaperone IbpA